MVVGRQLVPIEYSQLYFERRLVPTDVEQHFLIPLRIEGVSNDARPEDLLAERDDDEGVHVPARTSHCKVEAG